MFRSAVPPRSTTELRSSGPPLALRATFPLSLFSRAAQCSTGGNLAHPPDVVARHASVAAWAVARKPRRLLRCADRVVVRSPLLPAAAVLARAPSDHATSRERMRAALEDPSVIEAIWLASPGLAGEIERWRTAPDSARGRAIERSLWKYLVRMATRATPFGTFSGVTTASLGREAVTQLQARNQNRRRTRLDNDVLFVLADTLVAARENRGGLRWFPNSSLYQTAAQYRYAEARVDGRDRSYHLVSVEPTWYLDAVLARAAAGATLADLAGELCQLDAEIEADEATAYVHELIDAQILRCRLGVMLTGREPIDAFIDAASDGGLADCAAALSAIRDELGALDDAGLAQPPSRYEQVAAQVNRLSAQPSTDLARLFQVDMAKPAPELTLPRSVARDVADALELLARVFPPEPDPSLRRFADAFTARYEDRVVPLADALDEDTGIGFERVDAPGAEGSPLLVGLPFPPADDTPTTPLGPRERALLRLSHDCAARGTREVILDDALLGRLGAADRASLPGGTSALVRVAAPSARALTAGDYRVLVEGASGPSGAQLLGRFCYLDDDIHTLVRDHLRAEEATRPGARFAEIAHLNEGRIGNIQCRPVLRSAEIPYLGLSGADEQIPLTDLTVSVARGRIILRSVRLDCEVVPRLSTAHNFRLRSLGVYRFLCALQAQDGGGIGWSWGAANVAPFLPRVTRDRAVLCRARWRLDAGDIEPITSAARGGSALTAIADLRDRCQLPRHVVLADGDNELHIDLDDDLAVDVLAHELAGRTDAILTEAFPAPDALWLESQEGRFASEVTLLFRQPPERTATGPEPTPRRQGRSSTIVYPPGSEWLYAKIYTGPGSVDRVLRDAITPLLAGARDAALVDRWFFLRYADPEHHLRVRFHGEPTRLAGTLVPALHDHLAPLLANGLVARVVLDTYVPEAIRYGGAAALPIAEQIFSADSDAVLAIVNLLEGDEGKDARWRLALLGTHMLLEDLGFDAAGRRSIIDGARAGFGREFRVDATMGRVLGKRYRAEHAAIVDLFAVARTGGEDHWLAPGIEPLRARARALAPLAAQLRAHEEHLASPLPDIAWSLVHMHINRILHASPRAQELAIYDLLSRSYASNRHRS